MLLFAFFFFSGTATTEIYTLSLHDALPISRPHHLRRGAGAGHLDHAARADRGYRSEEHTSELQSLRHLVCRLLLEKKKNVQLEYRMKHDHDNTQANTLFNHDFRQIINVTHQ